MKHGSVWQPVKPPRDTSFSRSQLPLPVLKMMVSKNFWKEILMTTLLMNSMEAVLTLKSWHDAKDEEELDDVDRHIDPPHMNYAATIYCDLDFYQNFSPDSRSSHYSDTCDETDDDGDGGDDLRRPDYARSIVILQQERNPWRQQE